MPVTSMSHIVEWLSHFPNVENFDDVSNTILEIKRFNNCDK